MRLALALEAALNRAAGALDRRLSRFDARNRWFGVGRTVLCLAELSVLLFTPAKALLVPVLGISDGPKCGSVQALSAFCLGHHAIGAEYPRWLLVLVLAVAASGYRPRWTVLPQLWAVYSIATSISVPDGGESIALIVSLLMVPLAIADDRPWHWRPATTAPAPDLRVLAFAAFCALRLQVAYIYLDTAISKFGVADWANGTAEYYFLRDNMFGVAHPLSGMFYALSRNTLVVVGMTWGALVMELAIAVCVLSSERWRKVGLALDIALHGMIIMTMGLWSFGLVMIGASIITATPGPRRPAAHPAEPPALAVVTDLPKTTVPAH
ncbi:sporulation-delaying protein SdpB family protein [Kitasatospora sp. NPDC008050]|uniref:sporulation-delaying protein SdpB family protein n=1 Tax=Kitasatospora sp. NPDC008050 TaxID=3364021 RepID=UPI0036E75221